MQLSVAQMTSQVDVYLKDQLSPYVQHLENVTTACESALRKELNSRQRSLHLPTRGQ